MGTQASSSSYRGWSSIALLYLRGRWPPRLFVVCLLLPVAAPSLPRSFFLSPLPPSVPCDCAARHNTHAVRTRPQVECMLFEPASTLNTGSNATSDKTVRCIPLPPLTGAFNQFWNCSAPASPRITYFVGYP